MINYYLALTNWWGVEKSERERMLDLISKDSYELDDGTPVYNLAPPVYGFVRFTRTTEEFVKACEMVIADKIYTNLYGIFESTMSVLDDEVGSDPINEEDIIGIIFNSAADVITVPLDQVPKKLMEYLDRLDSTCAGDDNAFGSFPLRLNVKDFLKEV